MVTPWQDTDDYRAYLDAQEAKTRAWAGKSFLRVNHLAWQLQRLVPDIAGSALCVGCRNTHELDAFSKIGLATIGIDLVSLNPAITELDMHALTLFAPASFDVVVGCHVLEHAYDLPTVLREWHRVTRRGGIWVIEMPVHFTPTAVDRIDVKSVQGLWRLVHGYLEKPLWAQDNGKVIRLIARTK